MMGLYDRTRRQNEERAPGDYAGYPEKPARRKKRVAIGLLLAAVLTVAMSSLCGCGAEKNEQSREQQSSQKETAKEWPDDGATITLYRHESGGTEEITLREYLYGVVAGEMDTGWPVEALAAQAIMARTFTLEKMEDGGVPERGTDASTDIEEFQAYDETKINDAVHEAVDKTAGQVATYRGELVKAWFFADGGGRTAASALEGLGYDKEETPYVRSVEDPGFGLPDNPNHLWEASFSMEEVCAAAEQVTGTRREQFEKIEVAETGESGRATQYRLDDITVSAPAFRLALGGEKMKSNLIEEIAIADGALRVKGRGYGHGVGMSQWGARALAGEGKSAAEIVQYFFRDVEITQIAEKSEKEKSG